MNLKRLLDKAARFAGFNITRHPAPHLLSRHVKDFLHDNRINIVLDVGAYHGGYCEMLRGDAAYRHRIVSFEPTADSFAILRERMRGDKNWLGFHHGLSSSDSVMTLNNYGETGNFNSLLKLKDADAEVYGVDSKNARQEEVTLRRLDSVWSEITRGVEDPRVFLKMDTQGHDLAVTEGATGCLQYIIGMQSELPAVEIYEGMTPLPAALERYRALGYVPIGFYPVNTPESYGVSPEFDVMFKQFRR